MVVENQRIASSTLSDHQSETISWPSTKGMENNDLPLSRFALTVTSTNVMSFNFAIPGYTFGVYFSPYSAVAVGQLTGFLYLDPLRKKYFPSVAPSVVTSFNHSASSASSNQPSGSNSSSSKRRRGDATPHQPPSRKGKERARPMRSPIEILSERARGHSKSSRT